MTAPLAVACAVTFVWLGMVLAISFLDAPLKFRAPEVTLRIGLGIGRLVFGALNTIEAIFAATLLVSVISASAAVWIRTSVVVVVAILGVQLVLVRPRLARRTNRILAGAQASRSGSHHVYVALETGKCMMLIISGVLLLSMRFDGEASHTHHDRFHPAQCVATVTTPTAKIARRSRDGRHKPHPIFSSAKPPRNPPR